MSLRFRLIALVIAALSTSLALGGTVILINDSRSVRTEMRAALRVGRQTVDAALGTIGSSSDPQHGLDALVASFKGSRHLRLSAVAEAASARVYPIKERASFGGVPGWFVRLVGVAPETDRETVAIGGQHVASIVIETDPRNEIVEVWNELNASLVVLVLFCGLTIVFIHRFAGRALRPLRLLAAALEQVGQGDYAVTPIGGRLTPELAALRDSFNRMAARLAAIDADNRRLNQQLLNLQEEERNDLARDLHDEVGPLLFAITVDVGSMTRLLNAGRVDELAVPIQSIAEAAQALQGHVRGMLRRLRPIGLNEFGLAEALHGLIGFWRRRYPDIDYRLSVAADRKNFGNQLDMTIYRIAQECLSNAVRHAKPTVIAVSVSHDARRERASIEVSDNGPGLRDHREMGYGLIGMEERVRAMGGRLTLVNGVSGGLSVQAMLPCIAVHDVPLRQVSEPVP